MYQAAGRIARIRPAGGLLAIAARAAQNARTSTGGTSRGPSRKGKLINKPACGRPRVYVRDHALKRMKARKIAERELFSALNNLDETGLPTQAGRKHNCWYRSEEGNDNGRNSEEETEGQADSEGQADQRGKRSGQTYLS